MNKKFLIPVTAAISALLGAQANATLPQQSVITVPVASGTATLADQPAGTTVELSTFSGGNEYVFLLERNSTGVLMAYHSSHRSHSSHSSHSSHYSSR